MKPRNQRFARALAVRVSRAFSLIELLVVIAIIVILAAMLLPVLNRGKMRAKQIQCVNNMREMGLAFNTFAHDHDSRFPMQVPTNSGGALEYVQRGYLIPGEFYFTFRIFQTISNELVTARHLACPGDTRVETNTFSYVQNENLSYFVGVNAQPGNSLTVLAGDRNLSPDMVPPVSIYHLYNTNLSWNRDIHRYKGNLLFADSHVEQTKTPVLRQDVNQNFRMADVFMPSARGVSPVTSRGPGGGGGPTGGGGPGGGGSPGSGGGPSSGGGPGGSSGPGGGTGSGGGPAPSQPQVPTGTPIAANSSSPDKPTTPAPWTPTGPPTTTSTRSAGGNSTYGNGLGYDESKTKLTNKVAHAQIHQTNNIVDTNAPAQDPMVAAAPHYFAQGNNWLLWLLVLLIGLFLLVLEIRRRMDERARRRSRGLG